MAPRKTVASEELNEVTPPLLSEPEVVAATESIDAVSPPAPTRGFEPEKHLMKLKGKAYLEVKWRLVWLRDVQPEAVIESDLVSYKDNEAVFKAKVTLPNGASATGWGSETKGDFGDYLEKAETKAIGRALGALGYGTQFSDDFEFGADQGKVVDSPVSRGVPQTRSNGGTFVRSVDSSTFPPQNVPDGWACEVCGTPVVTTTKPDGTIFEAGQKAAWSMRDLGQILCFPHAKEAKERKAAQG